MGLESDGWRAFPVVMVGWGGWDYGRGMDDGDTVSIAGCGRAGYWCKNTLVLCTVPGSRVLLSCRNGGVIWTGFCVIYCSQPGE